MLLDCSGRLWKTGTRAQESVKAKLSWKITLSELEGLRIMNRENIPRETNVDIKIEGNQRDYWPESDERTRVFQIETEGDGTNKAIKITINKWVTGLSSDNGRGLNGQYLDEFLYCRNTGINLGQKRVIYRNREIGHERGSEITKGPKMLLKTNVSLGGCEWIADEKKAECDLKVVTKTKQ